MRCELVRDMQHSNIILRNTTSGKCNIMYDMIHGGFTAGGDECTAYGHVRTLLCSRGPAQTARRNGQQR